MSNRAALTQSSIISDTPDEMDHDRAAPLVLSENMTEDELLAFEQQQLASMLGSMALGDGNAGDVVGDSPIDIEHGAAIEAIAEQADALADHIDELTLAEISKTTTPGDAVDLPPLPAWQRWKEMMKAEPFAQLEKKAFDQLALRFGMDEVHALRVDPDYVRWCAYQDLIDPEDNGVPVASWTELADFLRQASTFESIPSAYSHFPWKGVRGLRNDSLPSTKQDHVPPTQVIGLSQQGTGVVIVEGDRLAVMVTDSDGPDFQLLTGYQLPVAEWGAPECANIYGSTVSLVFKRGAEQNRIDLVEIPSALDENSLEATFKTFIINDVDLVYVVATEWWMLLINRQKQCAAWSTTHEAARTPFEPLMVAIKKASAADPNAAGQRNPVNGELMEKEQPELVFKEQLVMSAFFDVIDRWCFVISTPMGICYRGRLPMLGPDSVIDPEQMRFPLMVFKDAIHMGSDSAQLVAGQKAPAKPTREFAINICMRSTNAADNLDFSIAQASESSISYISMSANYIRRHMPQLETRRAAYQATDEEHPCNCVAVLGTLLVAHSSSGEISLYSMLKKPPTGSDGALASTVADPNIPAVTRYYPSLYVRSCNITCLMPDGSVVWFRAKPRTSIASGKEAVAAGGVATSKSARRKERRGAARSTHDESLSALIKAEQDELIARGEQLSPDEIIARELGAAARAMNAELGIGDEEDACMAASATAIGGPM